MDTTRTIFINSVDKRDGNFTDYTVECNTNDPFFSIKDDERLMVYPSRFSVLNDFDNISTLNNTFQILIENLTTEVVTTYNVVLDNGVYTNYTLEIELQNKINAVLTSNSIPLTCVVSLDLDTLQYSYTFTAVTNYFDNNELRFNFNNLKDTPAMLMGFTEGEFIGVVTSTTTTITSDTASNMVFQPEIQVHCNLVSSNYQTSSSGLIPSQLFFSLSQGAKGGYISFENPSQLYKTNSISQFSNIIIRFLDDYERPIAFKSDSRIALTFIKEKQKTTDEKMLDVLKQISNLNELSLLSKTYLSN